MSKIIFATDFHIGGNLIAPKPGDITIWGQDWGTPMLTALLNYSDRTPEATFISGGDEITMLHEGRRLPKSDVKRRYFRNAAATRDLLLKSRVPVARVIGNHDPIGHLDSMGFNRASHVFRRQALPHTDVVILQPRIYTGEKCWFEYDADHAIAVIDEATNPNLIIGSHWAFDREELGISARSGYQYRDNTARIREHIETKIKQGKLHSVVSLHGHSHRFRYGKTGPIDMLTMPSFVQNDRQVPELPCGVFVEISEDKNNGELTTQFKRLLLKDEKGLEPVVTDIGRDEVELYQRGRKPKGSRIRPF